MHYQQKQIDTISLEYYNITILHLVNSHNSSANWKGEMQ